MPLDACMYIYNNTFTVRYFSWVVWVDIKIISLCTTTPLVAVYSPNTSIVDKFNHRIHFAMWVVGMGSQSICIRLMQTTSTTHSSFYNNAWKAEIIIKHFILLVQPGHRFNMSMPELPSTTARWGDSKLKPFFPAFFLWLAKKTSVIMILYLPLWHLDKSLALWFMNKT